MVRIDTTPPAANTPSRIRRLLPKAWLAFFLTLAALCLCHGRGKETSPSSSPTIAHAGLSLPAFSAAPSAAEIQPTAYPSGLRTQPIEDIQLGQRLPGRNPIREQVETVEPNPATWRAISLHMTKPSGRGLWIELLRPAEWLMAHDARVGGTVNIELPEMGAVGNAEVTAIGPCPPIPPGDGAVVTGTFKHETDGSNHIVRLGLEGQTELTAVTDNHAYWSADRQAFVEVGSLNIGELVDTEYGFNRVISLTPVAHTGFLYNLETTEHVYRVGSLGTLVHNNCLGNNMIQAGSYGSPGTAAHHIVAENHRFGAQARRILARFNIDLDSHWNGVWLPRSSRIPTTGNGALHAPLHSREYFEAVESRLSSATTRGQALKILQEIRRDLLNGTFPGVRGAL